MDRTFGLFTRSGIAAVGIGAVAYVAGWQLGWVELMVVAAGCLVAIVVALPFVIGRSRLALERTVSPQRVRAGDTAVAELRAVNAHRLPMRSVRVDESIDGQPMAIDVPRLAPGEEHLVAYPLPTDRRGVRRIGPAVVTRSDPAGLLRRQVAHTSVETLWVHPRWQFVRPLSAGFAKDLEGPTADDSPAGDIAFHAVRPYQVGDDPRHVHWMSSARAGQVMVRHYVDNRRPHLSVVVDSTPASYIDDEFEVAVQTAASLIVSMAAERLPVAVRVGREWITGKARPADHELALDRLTTVTTREDGPLAAVVSDALRVEPATSVIALVGTQAALATTMAAVAVARRHAKVIVVDVTADSGAIARAVPGARNVRAANLERFVAAWNRMT